MRPFFRRGGQSVPQDKRSGDHLIVRHRFSRRVQGNHALAPVSFPRLKQRLKERLAVIDRIKSTITHQIVQENSNELASFAPAHVL